jgi:mono/diheme cytochrome c family protein
MKLRYFLLGFGTTLGAMALVVVSASLLVVGSGLAPSNADAKPSAFESKFFTAALRASVSRHAKSLDWTPGQTTSEEVPKGSEIYESLCARCHGHLDGRPSALGSAFYPPAPNLRTQHTAYSEVELFWLIKHGVRNTGMPAWKGLLSDDEIGSLASLVGHLDAFPRESASNSQTAKTKSLDMSGEK